MKYIKSYENSSIELEPEEGDYVLFHLDPNTGDKILANLLNKHIAKVTQIYKKEADIICVKFEYNKILDEELQKRGAKNLTVNIQKSKIKYIAKTKKELYTKIDAEKYNL